MKTGGKQEIVKKKKSYTFFCSFFAVTLYVSSHSVLFSPAFHCVSSLWEWPLETLGPTGPYSWLNPNISTI